MLWLLAANTACLDETHVGRDEEAAFVDEAGWPNRTVSVCFRQDGYAVERAAVQSAAEGQIEGRPEYTFNLTGWGTCSEACRADETNCSGIFVDFVDSGTSSANRLAGGQLKMTISLGCSLVCVQKTVVHEFLHALGFAHEQNRADKPASCSSAPAGGDADLWVGEFDDRSVMAYCNPDNNDGQLSDGDVAGLARLYGGIGDVFVSRASGSDLKQKVVEHDDFCDPEAGEVCRVGDVDGDGKADIVRFQRTNGGEVYVALSRGKAELGPMQRWHAFFCSDDHLCYVADVDADGDADIIEFTRGAGADVRVARSNGVDGFGVAESWHDYFCTNGETCRVGDVDEDGRADIIAFSPYTRDVWVATSDGSEFANARIWHGDFCGVGDQCHVGDIDDDDRADIVRVRASDGRVFVARSELTYFSGAYVAKAVFPTDGTSHLYDVTGDGRADLIGVSRGGTRTVSDPHVYIANMSVSGTFGSTLQKANWLCAGDEVCDFGDVDEDGLADIVSFSRGDVKVAFSRGNSGGIDFVRRQGTKWHNFFCIGNEVCKTGDVDGDGDDDIVAFTRGTTADVYVALAGDNGFVGQGVKWHDYFCTGSGVCELADVDGDGDDDLIWFTRGASADVWVALSNGVNGFGQIRLWHQFFCAYNEVCRVGDVDRDGRADIITFTRGNYRDVWVATSNGSAFVGARIWHWDFCSDTDVCDVADVTGDRRADLVRFTRGNTGDVFVAASNGSSFYGPASGKWHDSFCYFDEQCRLGDVTGDERADLVAFQRGDHGQVFMARSTGAGFLGSGNVVDRGFCLRSDVCMLADFDGDGDDDAVAFKR